MSWKKIKKIVIDGQVYAQRITGQYRYADEILTELDNIILKDEIEIIIPEYVNIAGKFKNIKVIQYGKVKGILWSQTSLVWYLKAHNAIALGFCNTTSLLRPGIAVVHDVGYKVLKNQYRNLYGRCSALWHKLNYYVIAHTEYPIITVSEFSKKQICQFYGVDAKRISVISNGWQHIKRIKEDETVFEKYKNIVKGQYYFALGSLEERKNFKWIIEIAKRNPKDIFVIAGGAVKNNRNILDIDSVSNVILPGYVSDGYVKALMRNCKAFLFPSTFEGFGIPPLEALSMGVNVFCSNAACMPEICGEAVDYFDPYDYEYTLNESSKKNGTDILEKYSWKLSAEKMYEVIKGVQNDEIKA